MLKFRRASSEDLMLYFEWANNEDVRKNAINKSAIKLEDHTKWFTNRLTDPDTIMLLFSNEEGYIGQLRIEINHEKKEGFIDSSVDKKWRGKGYGTLILLEGYKYFRELNNGYVMTGIAKIDNHGSLSFFAKAGFKRIEPDPVVLIGNEEYIKFSKND